MAKLKKATKADISAALSDNVVVRKYRNQMVLSKVTEPRKSKSKKKEKTNSDFQAASHYATWILKQPAMEALYAKGINDKKLNAYTVAVTDYMTAPKIHYIKTEAYTGAVGGKVRIKATDDFQVTEVHVEITAKNGKVLEKGVAERYRRKPVMWLYTNTVRNTDLPETIIRVTAEDRPGNESMMEIRIEKSPESK